MSHACNRCGKKLYANNAECNCKRKTDNNPDGLVCDCRCSKAVHVKGAGRCMGCGICSTYTMFGVVPV